jgi:hypothetical protein
MLSPVLRANQTERIPRRGVRRDVLVGQRFDAAIGRIGGRDRESRGFTRR